MKPSHHDQLGGLTDGDRELMLGILKDIADRLSERPSMIEAVTPSGWKVRAKGPSWLVFVISGLAAGSFITWLLTHALPLTLH
jgi:hypothetical protein